MPVISFVSPKGGVGKSTSALVLASEYSHAGADVTLIDADPNHPQIDWAKLPGKPENLTVTANNSEETLPDEIDEARERGRFTIVDLEGSASARVTFAVAASDLVVIPLNPSALDIRQAVRAIKLVRLTGRSQRREIPSVMLFSRTPAAIETRTYKDIKAQLKNTGIPVLGVELIEREAFRCLFSFGGTLHSSDPAKIPNIESAKANAKAYALAIHHVLKEAGRA